MYYDNICIYIYIHNMYIHMCIIYIYIYIYIYMYIYIYVMYTHVYCIYINIMIYIYKYICTCIYIYLFNIHTHMYYIYIYMRSWYIYICVYLHVYKIVTDLFIYLFLYFFVHWFVFIYLFIYFTIYIYVYMYTHTLYIYIYIYHQIHVLTGKSSSGNDKVDHYKTIVIGPHIHYKSSCNLNCWDPRRRRPPWQRGTGPQQRPRAARVAAHATEGAVTVAGGRWWWGCWGYSWIWMIIIWRLPEKVVPPNHPFGIENHGFWASPILENLCDHYKGASLEWHWWPERGLPVAETSIGPRASGVGPSPCWQDHSAY